MANIVETSGNTYSDELNQILDIKSEIEGLVQQCQDDIENGDSDYLDNLSEVNGNVKDYYITSFSEFLEEMGTMFFDYSEQFADLDRLLKGRL